MRALDTNKNKQTFVGRSVLPASRTIIDFYHDPTTPECRAVMLTARAVGVELEYRLVDMKAGETVDIAFQRINPQRTIPTIVDKGFSLSESKAICAYLVNKYSPDNLLYPQRPENRAIVDQRLFFDNGSLTLSFHDLYDPYLYLKCPMRPDAAAMFSLALGELDKFLLGNHWAAGHHPTLADLCMVCAVNSAEVCEFDLAPFRNVVAWLERCKESLAGYDQANAEGLKTMSEMFSEAKLTVVEVPSVSLTSSEESLPPEPAPVAEEKYCNKCKRLPLPLPMPLPMPLPEQQVQCETEENVNQ